MSILNILIEIELKLKQYKVQFIFLFLFWFAGFSVFLVIEPNHTFWEYVLFSLTVRRPENAGDFTNFYSLVWPILLEVIVFGFIMGELLEKYNPIITSRILSKHKRNHTVVIGFHHLTERIIEHCIAYKESFCIIEDHEELVEDLINLGCPVVVGDPTETINLGFASVGRAKEVFIGIDDARIALICTEKIRKVNNKCPIYVRAFEDHVQDYLKQPPLNAISFSTSKWAMDGIQKWIKGKKGNVVVIGRDSLTHRIAYNVSLQPDREVFLFDDEHDGIEFSVNDRLHFVEEFARYLSDLQAHVNLEEVTQAFICWKRDSEFDESLYLTSKLRLRYPHIEIFVRIFDEELVDLVENYKAKTFSTSSNAFKKLQELVPPFSAIAPKFDD
ncbi:MAG: NAD-binding protein [Candidatus Lokiarchaeota archaeon]|nr:NAD-binding protein [Candidatus Lokiarchaeota archaeon]